MVPRRDALTELWRSENCRLRGTTWSRFVLAMKQLLKITAILTLALSFLIIPFRSARAADQYSFKVHNTTKDKITKLLASEDGKDFGSFDIGKGIGAGETATLNWDKKTNEKGCHWFFKAVFADGEESEAKKFDFCEDDLELEF
ncbi:MAG: hypothetical protein M3Z64_02880 [Verrucomicrobiota bacterium]|nr:hypothetical protein [Verrucomicrobiota bacterium]